MITLLSASSQRSVSAADASRGERALQVPAKGAPLPARACQTPSQPFFFLRADQAPAATGLPELSKTIHVPELASRLSPALAVHVPLKTLTAPVAVQVPLQERD